MSPPDPWAARDRRPPDPGWRGVAVAVAIAVAIPVGLWALSAPLPAATGVAALGSVALAWRGLTPRVTEDADRSRHHTHPASGGD